MVSGSCDCSDDGAGWLLDQTYGEADIPQGWTPVQACDTCKVFRYDSDAARAAAAYHGNLVVKCFPAVPDPEGERGHDEWAILPGSEAVWVNCSSHRARSYVERAIGGKAEDFFVMETYRHYLRIPQRFTERVRGIKGVRVLRKQPAPRMFRSWS